jgi:hypothetical protein
MRDVYNRGALFLAVFGRFYPPVLCDLVQQRDKFLWNHLNDPQWDITHVSFTLIYGASHKAIKKYNPVDL